MIRYEELFTECQTCGGSGQVENFPTKLSGADVKLTGACPTCEGRGGEYTEQGRELARFINRVRQSRFG